MLTTEGFFGKVCELWNGESIVRVMGSAPVQEFIFFEPVDNDPGGGAVPASDKKTERLLRVSTLEEEAGKHSPIYLKRQGTYSGSSSVGDLQCLFFLCF